MQIGIIGEGAIGYYVVQQLNNQGKTPSVVLVRRTMSNREPNPKISRVTKVSDLPTNIDLMVDCAGHAALAEHGPEILKKGISLITVSAGALADKKLEKKLTLAAISGRAKIYLASGAIGALDCLQSARVGGLSDVTYIGRKLPVAWLGSPAEKQCDLNNLNNSFVHFEGNARQAAMDYPRNANVAATVALAGLGFDKTKVRLIADPMVSGNIHEIKAVGDFGNFSFRLESLALSNNPRSSALAAMSVVSAIERQHSPVTF